MIKMAKTLVKILIISSVLIIVVATILGIVDASHTFKACIGNCPIHKWNKKWVQ